MKNLKKYLVKNFGPPAVRWLADEGRKKVKAFKSKNAPQKMLKEFLLSIGAEDRIEHYVSELAKMTVGGAKKKSSKKKSAKKAPAKKSAKKKTAKKAPAKKKATKKKTAKKKSVKAKKK